MRRAANELFSGGCALGLSGLGLLAATGAAEAHVKWFCAYDVAGQPQGLEQVLCPDFEWLTGLALVCLMLGCLAEGTPLGGALLNALDRVTARIRTDTELLVRATLGFFLVSLWNLGDIILTPELKTDVAWIPWLQLAHGGLPDLAPDHADHRPRPRLPVQLRHRAVRRCSTSPITRSSSASPPI